MIRFFLISFIALAFSSCALKITENFLPVENSSETYEVLYFADTDKDYIYKAKIQLNKHHFGGLLIIKKQGEDHYRLMMSTEFGNTLLDYDFQNNQFHKRFAIPALDRKIVLSTLEKDFELLLTPKILISKTFESASHKVYQAGEGNARQYYFINNKEILERQVYTSKRREKTEIKYWSKEGKSADSICIDHKNFNLKIDLKKI